LLTGLDGSDLSTALLAAIRGLEQVGGQAGVKSPVAGSGLKYPAAFDLAAQLGSAGSSIESAVFFSGAGAGIFIPLIVQLTSIEIQLRHWYCQVIKSRAKSRERGRNLDVIRPPALIIIGIKLIV